MEVVRSCLTSSFLFYAARTSIYISWTGLLILINYNFCGPTYWFLILIFIPWCLIFIFVFILHLLARFTKEKLQVLVFIKVLLLTLVVSMMGKSSFMFWGNFALLNFHGYPSLWHLPGKLYRWVPIKGNDWYWIRHHIKVGMHVLVEILVSILITFHTLIW